MVPIQYEGSCSSLGSVASVWPSLYDPHGLIGSSSRSLFQVAERSQLANVPGPITTIHWRGNRTEVKIQTESGVVRGSKYKCNIAMLLHSSC